MPRQERMLKSCLRENVQSRSRDSVWHIHHDPVEVVEVMKQVTGMVALFLVPRVL